MRHFESKFVVDNFLMGDVQTTLAEEKKEWAPKEKKSQ